LTFTSSLTAFNRLGVRCGSHRKEERKVCWKLQLCFAGALSRVQATLAKARFTQILAEIFLHYGR